MAGQQGEQGRAESVHIGANARLVALEYLGRGEGGRAGDQTAGGAETARNPGDSEIHQLRFAVCAEQDIRRFDVAVQDLGSMRALDRARQLDPGAHRIRPGERPPFPNDLFERTPGAVGHHDERLTGRGDIDLEDIDDIRMAGQPTHRLFLTQESLTALGIDLRGEHLDSDHPIQRVLDTAIDNAEPTPADLDRIRQAHRLQLVHDLDGRMSLRIRSGRSRFGVHLARTHLWIHVTTSNSHRIGVTGDQETHAHRASRNDLAMPEMSSHTPT